MDNSTENYTDYYNYDMENVNNSCKYEELPVSYKLIPILYMLIFILGLSGNGMVIFIVWKATSKRRPTDVYIGNLALADLTFVVTLPLWAVYMALGYHWPFGMLLCKLSGYVVMLNMFAALTRFSMLSSTCTSDPSSCVSSQ